ncbi:MAG: DUF2974 domain-containing protein [Clostridia bacterium]|nr:DUF2974 domain-containing protein [Clostridia bacterium]
MSEKKYTDEELCRATQIAYCNINSSDIEDYFDEYGVYPTLQEIMNSNGPDIYYSYEDLVLEAVDDPDKKRMKEGVDNLCSAIAAGEVCKDWRVVSVLDQNDETGLYAVTIKTDDDSIIVAYRGSESVSGFHFIKDWILADFGLIHNKPTEQQIQAGQYLDLIGSNNEFLRNIKRKEEPSCSSELTSSEKPKLFPIWI